MAPDPHEDKRRIDTELDSEVEHIDKPALAQYPAVIGMLDEEQLGVDKILPRNVCKQHSEGDREKEHRLELLSYRKIEKYPDY